MKLRPLDFVRPIDDNNPDIMKQVGIVTEVSVSKDGQDLGEASVEKCYPKVAEQSWIRSRENTPEQANSCDLLSSQT